MSLVSDPFDVDIRITDATTAGASPASWSPLKTKTIKCTKSTCRCTDTCASCSPNGVFC